ncbi:expressed unknown protein [Seminavis robusta]|uniref:Tudor domain-containing protein n=1 Tax=Seminavis robusta TaxID=568900 RepID=A0A9N8HHQ4_9STRA|nr:expressed unknown protein [Seminavis robusta]|eukprot:Sro652_g181770.1 n/a (244) ;mRNA; r:22553-23367
MAYREEVLMKRVAIRFDDGVFYSGLIQKVELSVGEDGKIESQHWVVFDDGDQRFFDIAEEEGDGRLKWEEKSQKASVASASNNSSGKRKAPDRATASGRKIKKKEEPEEEVDVTVVAVAQTRKKASLSKAKEDDETESDDGSEVQAEVQEDADYLDTLAPADFPDSIPKVIRLMDQLEPGMNYYERQADNRGECSKIRKKLRDFAQKEPDHPGIAHWVETKKWKPPNLESLRALIELLKTKID